MASSSQAVASKGTIPPPECTCSRYRGATNTEDDVAIIAQKCPLLPDDVGDSIDTAKPLPQLPASFEGLIGFGGDKDVFSFRASRGARVTVTLALVAPYYSPGYSSSGNAATTGASQGRSNLDAEVSLLNRTGHVLRTWLNGAGLLSGVLAPSVVPYQVGCACSLGGAWGSRHGEPTCWLTAYFCHCLPALPPSFGIRQPPVRPTGHRWARARIPRTRPGSAARGREARPAGLPPPPAMHGLCPSTRMPWACPFTHLQCTYFLRVVGVGQGPDATDGTHAWELKGLPLRRPSG